MEEKKRFNYSKSVLILVIITSVSKVFGFFRDIFLTSAYGASFVADAYLITLSIPDLILELLANTIMIGFVPLAVAKLSKSTDDLNEYTTSITKILLVASLVFSCVLALFPKQILSVLASGFDAEGKRLAIQFLKALSFTIIFKTVASILHAYLNTTKFFTPAAFLGIILDLSVILAILISKQTSLVYLLPIGALLGTLFQALFLFPFARKKGFRLLLKTKVNWRETKELLVMSVPALLSVGLLQISTLFNRSLSTAMGEGSVTMLNHASRISFFVENIIVSSIATVLYPVLSEYYIEGEKDKIKNSISDAIEKLLTFLVPATVGLWLLSLPIVDILYGHGGFTDKNVLITSDLMKLNVIGIVGIAVQTVLTRAMFSMKKIKVSIAMSLSLLVVYLGSSLILSKVWGLMGIACASGVSYTVGGIAYYVVTNKICGNLNLKATALEFIKIILASGVMGLAVFGVMQLLNASAVLEVICSVAVGVVVYAIMAKLLRLKHFSVKTLLKKKKI